jgi:hypothetical protein
MTLNEFKSLKRFEGQRVRMAFADGEEIIATLFSITTDLDESQHLIYEKVEQSTVARPNLDTAGAYYSPGDELISCVLEPLD